MEFTRCSGLCCKAFTIGVPAMFPEELEEALKIWNNGGGADAKGRVFDPKENLPLIVEMVIPLGRFKWNPYSGKPYYEWTVLYTCKYHQEDGNCGIYDKRPLMCRRYPNMGVCEYQDCGCTWGRPVSKEENNASTTDGVDLSGSSG